MGAQYSLVSRVLRVRVKMAVGTCKKREARILLRCFRLEERRTLLSRKAQGVTLSLYVLYPN